MTTEDFDIELQLLLDAIYLKYHYDFRGYALASLKRRLRDGAWRRFGCADAVAAAGPGAARAGDVPGAARLPHRAGERDVPRSGVLPGAAREGGAAAAHLSRRSRSGSPAAARARRSTRSRSCCARRACSSATLIYATDINPQTLQKAEAGVYDVDRIAGVHREPPAIRRARHRCPTTTRPPTAARCSTSRLRQHIVFSDHSLATDSVFAEVQLVSCRNVLIYFNRELQDRALGLFQRRALPQGIPRHRRRRSRCASPRMPTRSPSSRARTASTRSGTAA